MSITWWHRRQRPRANKVRLECEGLEDRTLPAAFVFQNTLHIRGDELGAPSNDNVDVRGDQATNALIVTLNGTSLAFPLDGSYTAVAVDLGGGRDTLTMAFLDRARNGLAPLTAITIDGGAGNDTVDLRNAVEDDTYPSVDVSIYGGPGDDFLLAGNIIRYFMFGGSGNDTFRSGPGSDAADGRGPDASSSPQTLGAPGTDTYEVFAGLNYGIDDTLVSGHGEDAINNIAVVRIDLGDEPINFGVGAAGLTGKLEVNGGPGDNTLTGGSGADILNGKGGKDIITGNGGNDVLIGGDGDDTIYGGPGNDLIDAGAGVDEIEDTEGANNINTGSGRDLINGVLEPVTVAPPAPTPTASSPAPVSPTPSAPTIVPVLRVRSIRVREGSRGRASYAIFTITLSARAAGPVTVSFATANGSARSGRDYRRLAGRVTFRPGETRKQIMVRIVADNIAEPSRIFLLLLSKPRGALLANRRATATIVDDDRAL
jgi:hypothetical protein